MPRLAAQVNSPERAYYRLALLGHPVAHSLSKGLHEAALAHCKLRGGYTLIDLPKSELAQRLQALRDGHYHGFNVTVPHKEAVYALCDELAPCATLLGAVNTVIRTKEGHVRGLNTDLSGLQTALRHTWPNQPWGGAPVAIIGAGGAARAAIAAAIALGAKDLRISNRTLSRAQALVHSLGKRFPGVRLKAVEEPRDAIQHAIAILQATSVGMGQSPHSEDWQHARLAATRALESADPGAVLYDLVYRPAETPWVHAALARGLSAQAGLDMLIHQAAAAFTLWTGHEAPLNAMREGLNLPH